MVIYEGIGLCAPAPAKVVLSGGDIRTVVAEATSRCNSRRYDERSDSWGQGFLGKVVIPNVAVIPSHLATVVAGMIGEYAVASYINHRIGKHVCKIDLSLRNAGDGGIDLLPNGISVDVKTRLQDYGAHLIRRRRDSGSIVRWHCNLFVFAQWERSMTVQLMGWCWASFAESLPECAARRGNHRNVEIKPVMLLPMNRLIYAIEAQQ